MDTQHSRRRGIRFFEWLRGIGIRRQDGWFGGVCGGLAARWGIDPLIVRGIVVVATLLSLPMLLLYALAWFLLPAEDGAIHAESMLNGELAPSQFGILLLLLVALVPGGRGVGWGLVSAGPWQWGWGAWPWFADGWGAFWTVALVVAGVWLVVVAARSRGDRPADGEDRPGGAAAPGTPAGPTAAASAASGVTAEAADAAAGAGGSDSASGAGAQPVDDAGTRRTDPAAAEGSSTAEWSAWAEQRDQWSAQSHAASAPLSDEEQRRRYLNEQRRHRLETARLRREERRARTRRLPAAVSWLVVGVALLVGVGAWALLAPSLGDDALLPSLGATLAVLSLGILVAGLLRRRSIGLAALSVPLAVTVASSLIVPWPQLDAGMLRVADDATSASQAAGQMDVVLDGADEPRRLRLEQGAGEVRILLRDGAGVRLTVDSAAAEIVLVDGADGETQRVTGVFGTWSGALGASSGSVSEVHLTLGAGEVRVVREDGDATDGVPGAAAVVPGAMTREDAR